MDGNSVEQTTADLRGWQCRVDVDGNVAQTRMSTSSWRLLLQTIVDGNAEQTASAIENRGSRYREGGDRATCCRGCQYRAHRRLWLLQMIVDGTIEQTVYWSHTTALLYL